MTYDSYGGCYINCILFIFQVPSPRMQMYLLSSFCIALSMLGFSLELPSVANSDAVPLMSANVNEAPAAEGVLSALVFIPSLKQV